MKKFVKWFLIGLLVVVVCAMVVMALNQLLPEGHEIGAKLFVTIAGMVLSIVFTFLPKLRVQFAALASEVKSLVNVGVMLAVAGLMFVFTCTNWNPFEVILCTVQGGKDLGVLVFLAVVSNQVTYLASPQPADVKLTKFSREQTS